ncbi:class I SAM-dependent methyltransferase [Schlesneria paludicola]|uniref:class I SAM-dependent methyltransferase n=1 Tax=Schlesneria paludicola TaxID=360056 RepID=UPI0012FAB163|nr:class I SAM-dependent methyltransferase [Schlesneria paludicola]
MNKIQRLLAIHGVAGTLRLFVAKATGLLFYLTPARRRARAAARERDLSFDRKWGVDTSGMIIPDVQDVVGTSWEYGSRYQGIDVVALEQSLRDLKIDFGQFTFVDFGSGKGRAVLVAAQIPFRKVIGVEYSDSLNRIALQNLARFPADAMKCQDVDLICADAANLTIPDGPLVLFFYNPFGEAVMSQVVENVRNAVRAQSRRIVVLYFYAVAAQLWRDSGFMGEVQSGMQLSLYDTMCCDELSAAA